MIFDLNMIKKRYEKFPDRVKKARSITGAALSLAEKILYAHLDTTIRRSYRRGKDYVEFRPDRVAMQDATAQMALLQFMQSGKKRVSVPATVHCDHLIQAKDTAKTDLELAKITNREVYDFLSSVSDKYGIGFWKAGAGIIHQVILENYAFPGGMMIGTDSHTVNAGGLGMLAIGVGGADAVDVMAGMPWELKFPKLIGIKLTGKLSGWTSAKDIILKVAEILTTKGGTGCIIEYFGDGASELSCTGKGTICNMGAEVGATASVFGYDEKMSCYLRVTGRADVADLADKIKTDLIADPAVYENPLQYFDQVIEINLSELEPYLNGPFTPDLATPISKMKEKAEQNNWPTKLEFALIGSCTNSSYEDISRSASIAKQASEKKLLAKARLTITPGSEQVRYTAERDGLIKKFNTIGATVFANACGPCIGQWARDGSEKQEKNTIVHSFNRNFAKRADGNPNTYAFVASPELVTALSIAGDLTFNPLTDTLVNRDGVKVKFEEPSGFELPENGFDVKETGYRAPSKYTENITIRINANSERLQLLEPFSENRQNVIRGAKLLIKAKGKCTTDHISMAGIWLKYRGHLDNISKNLLIGAVNAFSDKTNLVRNQLTADYMAIPDTARSYKAASIPWIIVADENYGEGSSREHAAMEPRHLGGVAVIVKSFARIHETNLKKQGMLALTFSNPSDYDLIKEDDNFDILDLEKFAPNRRISMQIYHANGSADNIELNHSYNEQQIKWYKAGSALNLIAKMESN